MSERQIVKPAQGRWARKAFARVLMIVLAATVMSCVLTPAAWAQDAPYYAPDQLDRLVQRVALYPDPLLAQVLAAATYPDEIPDAARWADRNRGVGGDELAARIQDDQLPWDPSVQALLPFPSVLDTMASNMGWTQDLGNAFLANQQDVMYAVQRMRQRARDYGYLRSGPEIVVSGGPYIVIAPARPDYIVVPTYDPVVVYARPRPGFFVGAAIGFRFGVGLGVAYRPWGWGYNRISWNERVVIVNNAPWHRTWVNRTVYVHPYTVRRVVVHDRGWNDRHEAMEREREHFAHERAEHHEAVRHEEHREAERREDRREAERREERHDAYRDARHDDHHEDHRDVHPVREAHNDVGHAERRDVGHDDHGRDNHNNGHGNDSHGNNGNHNGNSKDKDHDDHGHGDHDGHGR